jgi:hypothetical protein
MNLRTTSSFGLTFSLHSDSSSSDSDSESHELDDDSESESHDVDDVVDGIGVSVGAVGAVGAGSCFFDPHCLASWS